MAKFSIDSDDLRNLSVDLGQASADVGKEVRNIFAKGAVNIKDAIRDDFRASGSFHQIARDVNYDEIVGSNGIEFHIGPRAGLGPGRQGGLAGIAVDGGANSGGGKVRDPSEALADELPVISRFVDDLIKRSL